MRKLLGLGLSLLVCLSVPVAPPAAARQAHASGGGSGMTYQTVTQNIQDPIEQETDWPFPADQSQWVINPSRSVPCSWDVDDHWQQYAQGTLNAGASLTVDECVIASPTCFYRTSYGQTAHWCQQAGFLGQKLQASTSGLTVSMCWQPQGRCFTPSPVYDSANRVYVWKSCARAQYTEGDPTLVSIPGSQGGIGLYQTVTVTVTNPTSHNARNVFSDVSAVGTPWYATDTGESGCPGENSGLYMTDYPFTYYVS